SRIGPRDRREAVLRRARASGHTPGGRGLPGKLAPQKQVVHLPELSLCVGGLSRQRGVQRVRMNFRQREISKGEGERIAESLAHRGNAEERPARVGTLVVSIDQQAGWRRQAPTKMVSGGDLNRGSSLHP